ncbi:MAG: ABC transporter substrate-binding protein, partial [Elusimicrobiota bacterium]
WILSDWTAEKTPLLKKLALRFSIEHPDIKIDISTKTRKSMWTDLFSHFRDPKFYPIADILEIPHHWTSVLAKMGLLIELNQIIDVSNLNKCMDFLKSGCIFEGTDAVFSFPLWMEIPALHCRMEHLEKTSGCTSGSLDNWTEFLKMCQIIKRKQTKKNSSIIKNAGTGSVISTMDIMMCVWNRGGDIFSADYNRSTLNREEFAKGVEDYIDLAVSGLMELSGETFLLDSPMISQPGQLAFCARTPNLWKNSKRKNTVQIFPYPGISDRPNLINSYNMAVSSNSANFKEVTDFLKFLLSIDNTEKWTRGIYAFPCYKSLFNEVISEGNFGIYNEIVSKAKMFPNIAVSPTIELLIDRVLWDVSKSIVRKKYSEDELVRRLIIVHGEADYLLSHIR